MADLLRQIMQLSISKNTLWSPPAFQVQNLHKCPISLIFYTWLASNLTNFNDCVRFGDLSPLYKLSPIACLFNICSHFVNLISHLQVGFNCTSPLIKLKESQRLPKHDGSYSIANPHPNAFRTGRLVFVTFGALLGFVAEPLNNWYNPQPVIMQVVIYIYLLDWLLSRVNLVLVEFHGDRFILPSSTATERRILSTTMFWCIGHTLVLFLLRRWPERVTPRTDAILIPYTLAAVFYKMYHKGQASGFAAGYGTVITHYAFLLYSMGCTLGLDIGTGTTSLADDYRGLVFASCFTMFTTILLLGRETQLERGVGVLFCVCSWVFATGILRCLKF